MTSASLYRWSGMALLVGAILGIVGDVLSSAIWPGNAMPQGNQWTLWTIVWLVSLIGEMCMLIGLPGILARLAGHGSGTMGLLGFALTFFGGFLLTSFSVVAIVALPTLLQSSPNFFSAAPPPAFLTFFLVANILFGVGGLLLGIAVMRSEVLPRLSGLLLLVGAVLGVAAFPLNGLLSTVVSSLSFILFAIGIGWMGITLSQESRAEIAEARVA